MQIVALHTDVIGAVGGFTLAVAVGIAGDGFARYGRRIANLALTASMCVLPVSVFACIDAIVSAFCVAIRTCVHTYTLRAEIIRAVVTAAIAASAAVIRIVEEYTGIVTLHFLILIPGVEFAIVSGRQIACDFSAVAGTLSVLAMAVSGAFLVPGAAVVRIVSDAVIPGIAPQTFVAEYSRGRPVTI